MTNSTETQILTIGRNDYFVAPLERGGFLMSRSTHGATYVVHNGVEPLVPGKKYAATSLTGTVMRFRGNVRWFTVDDNGVLVLA